MEKIKVEENQFIIKIGEASDNAYIVLKGEVGVFFSLTNDKDEARPDFLLGENEVFGEIGIINDSLRSASIKSLTPVELLKIDRNPQILRLLGLIELFLCQEQVRFSNQYHHLNLISFLKCKIV